VIAFGARNGRTRYRLAEGQPLDIVLDAEVSGAKSACEKFSRVENRTLSTQYTADFQTVASLAEAERMKMETLYLSSYDETSAKLFRADLAEKDEVLLLRHAGRLVGFTTVRMFSHRMGNRWITVVYSGDTVVDQEHWGQQALAFTWIRRMGALKSTFPERPLFWFLLVKGHRTFRYLPAFAKSFYPHWNLDRSDLKPLADALAAEKYPGDYNPASGVVEFVQSRGQLKSAIAAPNARELERDDVRFFLRRNPRFERGHELVCLCELELHNMKPLAHRLFIGGMRAN
jgi:hypothetical protein